VTPESSPEGGPTPSRFYLEIFLVSAAVILVEVSYTRIFSFKLFYYFTYLVLGLALLGLGAGGVFVATVPALRRLPAPRLVALACLVGAGGVLAGYFVVARTPLNAFAMVDALSVLDAGRAAGEALKFAAVCLGLFVPFLAAGLAIATIFGTRPDAAGRLYFADLLGASLAAASSVWLISTLSPPRCVTIGGVLLAAAGARLAAATRERGLLAATLALALVLVGASLSNELPDPVPDGAKSLTVGSARAPARVIFSDWSPVFRVDVMENPLELAVSPGTPVSSYMLAHDGLMGSMMRRFDGDVATLARLETDERSLPFRTMDGSPAVLIIGAAGGSEIHASLYFGAAHVTAIELNPVTVSLLRDRFADFTGRLAEHPRVTLVNAEGRSFLAADPRRYDLVWFVTPDSYAAMNAATAGAFVLSESYLYTVEMIVEALGHLADGGIVCAQFAEPAYEAMPVRTARYLSTAREAFRRLGIADFDQHVLVSSSKGLFTAVTVLLKRDAFRPGEAERFVRQTGRLNGGTVRHAAAAGLRSPALERVIASPPSELAAWYTEQRYQMAPVTDDSPFFWHFVRFRDAFTRGGGTWRDAAGERLLVVLVVAVTVIAAALLLLPFVLIRDTWRQIPHKARASVYFAGIGLGFMFIEISVIQRFTLFLGYPTYSLTVTLFALLVFTGLGSLLSERWAHLGTRGLVPLLVATTAVVLVHAFGTGVVFRHLIAASLAARVAVAVVYLAPLGLCLGAFMPIGLRTVAGFTEHRVEVVAWSWAVNGFCSVVSSSLATILSMQLGFTAVLLGALLFYGAAVAALSGLPPRSLVPAR
jgi:hypothetical protein